MTSPLPPEIRRAQEFLEYLIRRPTVEEAQETAAWAEMLKIVRLAYLWRGLVATAREHGFVALEGYPEPGAGPDAALVWIARAGEPSLDDPQAGAVWPRWEEGATPEEAVSRLTGPSPEYVERLRTAARELDPDATAVVVDALGERRE